jgi:hypothetical protein
MKRLLIISAMAIVALMQNTGGRAQSTTTVESQQTLLTEVLQLRADILQFLLTTQQSAIQKLKNDLDQLQRQKRRIEEANATRDQQLLDIERQLSSSDLEPETRPQVEAIRQQLIGDAVEKSRSEQSFLREREADLTAKIAIEMQHQQALQRRAEQVQKALTR